MEEITKYLLIGGGVASVQASMSIRERDKEGRLVIVGAEPNPPTDRPPLSKQFLLKDEWTTEDPESKARDYYPNNRIDLLTGVKAVQLDIKERAVTLDNGTVMRYEKLLLATGSTPVKLDIPGVGLENVFYLRTVSNADALRNALRASKRAVLVGAGYIGMEVAAVCRTRGLEATIIEPNDRPWSKFASKETGQFLQRYFEGKGVRFVFGEQVDRIEGEQKFEALITDKGTRIEADMAVLSVGVKMNLDLAKEAGLEVDDKNGVVVDETLQTSDPNVWAAGDIAYFRDITIDAQWHAEHFLNAKWQGKTVGATLAGERTPYDQIAYFYSDMFDLHMNLRGNPQLGRNTRILGDYENGEYVELYFDDSGRLTMTLSFSHDDSKLDAISDKAEELLRAKTNEKEINESTFSL